MRLTSILLLILSLKAYGQAGITPSGSAGPGNAGMDGASDPFTNASPTVSREKESSTPLDEKNKKVPEEKILKDATSVKKLKK